ncbi:MAG: hypothetical protein ACR2RV_06660, partial [Verrucomicrobiales bacterium]
MKPPLIHKILSLCCVTALLIPIAGAKLVAWYPLDEPASDTELIAKENIADNDAAVLGFDANPDLSFVTRGNGSARQNLGTSY